MPTNTTIGLDLAKKVFQVHGVDAEGKFVGARKLRRKEVFAFFSKLPPCLHGGLRQCTLLGA
jgi:transposase